MKGKVPIFRKRKRITRKQEEIIYTYTTGNKWEK